MELPAPLAPWATELTIFPKELVGAVGPLVQRLDRLIGPPRLRDQFGTGDPDGFDGLIARGPYERLLLTDWLLASEVPDEFLRRAVMHEHSFLRLVHRTPSGARLSAALFDAGPEQWGTPRIGQIAALIVLHRRAAAAGLRFLWGIAQETPSEAAVFADVSPATLKHFLTARSTRPATEEDVAAWRAHFGAGENDALDDWWIVGGRRIGSLVAARSASVLHFNESEAREDSRQLIARVTRRSEGGSASPETPLDLPEERACIRLLRDPFEASTTAPVRQTGRFAPASNLIHTLSGRKLLARSSQNNLLAYPLPNSPRATAGPPKMYRSIYGTPLLAAGRIGKTTVLVSMTSNGAALRVETFGGKGTLPSGDFALDAPQDTADLKPKKHDIMPPPLGTCEAVHSEKGLPDLMVLLPSGRLLRTTFAPSEAHAKVVAEGVVAMAATYRGVVYIQATTGTVEEGSRDGRFMLKDVDPSGTQKLRLLNRGGGGRAFFGEGRFYSGIQYGSLAVEEDFGLWRIVRGEQEFTLNVPPQQRVVGLTEAFLKSPPGSLPVLVTLGEDQQTLHLLAESASETLTPAVSKIEQISVGAGEVPTISYATESGELIVYSLYHREILYRLLPDEAAATLPRLPEPPRSEE